MDIESPSYKSFRRYSIPASIAAILSVGAVVALSPKTSTSIDSAAAYVLNNQQVPKTISGVKSNGLEAAIGAEPKPSEAKTDYLKTISDAKVGTPQDIKDLIMNINRSTVATHSQYMAVNSAYSRAIESAHNLKEGELEYLALNYRARTLRDAPLNVVPKGEELKSSLGTIVSNSKEGSSFRLYNFVKAFSDYGNVIKITEENKQGLISPYGGLGVFGVIASVDEVRVRMIETIDEMAQLIGSDSRYEKLVPKLVSARKELLGLLPSEKTQSLLAPNLQNPGLKMLYSR